MKKLASRLKLTRTNLFGALFNKNKPNFDNNIINELEDRFLLADVGIKTTDLIIQLLTDTIKKNSDVLYLDEKIKQVLLPLLKPVEQNFTIPKNISKPYLVLVVGVNGVGKTTTAGKLPKYIKSENKSVLLKTHSALCTLENNPFTDKFNTAGVIYVVRDPRNVITSISHHYSLSVDDSVKFIKKKTNKLYSVSRT